MFSYNEKDTNKLRSKNCVAPSFFLSKTDHPSMSLKNSLIINGANHNRINMGGGGGVNQCTYKSKHIKIISTQALLTKVLNCNYLNYGSYIHNIWISLSEMSDKKY